MPGAGDVIQAYADLPDDEQLKVNRAIRALPDPPAGYIGPIWIIIVLGFVVLLLGGGYLLYELVRDGMSTEVIAPLVTGALGVLAGLLAPSPVAGRRQ